MRNNLRRVVTRTDDFLFVYYAGHGLRHDTKDELYLSVRDSDADALAESAVRFETVREVLEASPARTNLLVLDCCYSGMALGTMSGSPIEMHELEVRGSAVIASSPKNKKSHSPVGRRNTAFIERMASLETSGDLLLRRPAIRARRLDPATVPRTRPAVVPTPPRAPRPAPVPAAITARTAADPPDHAHHEAPRPGSRPSVLASRAHACILQVLWILTGLFVAMVLAGLVGVIVGEQPGKAPAAPR